MASNPVVKVVLSFPRTGTHFLWSRYIASGAYQLVYDADAIPGLYILSKKYEGTIKSLFPAPRNPNYNFQFSSLCEIDKPLSPRQYLEFMSKKYSADIGFDLFEKALALQDCNNKTLLVINRFVYTCSYNFLLDNCEWAIEDAVESLRIFYDWSKQSSHAFNWMLLTREEPEWLRSQARMGASNDLIERRLREYKKVMDVCGELGIATYSMHDVVACLNNNIINFENVISSGKSDLATAKTISATSAKTDRLHRRLLHYLTRTLSYLKEKDDYKRLSLVRSIGFFKYLFYVSSYLSKRYVRDYEGAILNNAKIKRK